MIDELQEFGPDEPIERIAKKVNELVEAVNSCLDITRDITASQVALTTKTGNDIKGLKLLFHNIANIIGEALRETSR